ncbi:MAG TPA: ASPIC/UnbV domain-containing protein, partial [Verrucomicrobiae bacterium]|nr:ASPIC/UnbV domain-containing protein [Verrucomicrobiae bacterium]
VGRGSAYADIDGDGDPDLVLTQVAGPPLLLRNDQKLNHHWVRLKLVGTRSNRDAIGAWVRARVGDETLWRQVMPTRSYLSQSELPVTFGLGKAQAIQDIEISWPSGVKQLVLTPELDTTTVVEERP